MRHPSTLAAWDHRIARVAPGLALAIAALVTMVTVAAYIH